MTDTPTTRLLMRKQSLGSNTNTWGDTKLSTDLDQIDRAMVGWQDYTVTGDATLSWTNYGTSNDFEVFGVELTGTPTAACTITVNSTQMRFAVKNSCGVTVTIKTSAGTGIAVPDDAIVLLVCNATNVENWSPNYGGVTSPANNLDIPNYAAVQTMIANASIPASAGTVLVSGTDTTAGYLASKLTSTIGTLTTGQVSGLTSIQLSTVGGVGNQQVLATLGGGNVNGFLYGGRFAAGTTLAVGYHMDLVSGATYYLPSAPTQGAKCSVALFNPAASYTIDPNGKKINNSTSALIISGGQTLIISYDQTLGDWE